MSTAHAMAGELAAHLEHLGLSQRQFADLVNASPKHVCLVLNGKATAHVNTLDRWALALGLRFDVRLYR